MVNHVILQVPAEAGMVIPILRMGGRRLYRCKGLTHVSDRAGGGEVPPCLPKIRANAPSSNSELPGEKFNTRVVSNKCQEAWGRDSGEETSISPCPR